MEATDLIDELAAAHGVTAACPAPSEDAAANITKRLTTLLKPPGALGHLEPLLIRIGSLQASDRPAVTPSSYIVFAADHGIAAQGVSPFPQAVTAIMLQQMAAGGAGSSVLAREAGAQFQVVDVGTNTSTVTPGVIVDKQRHGTRDFLADAAMEAGDLLAAFGAGGRAVQRAVAANAKLIVFGEMGIANTTAAAAVISGLTGTAPSSVVGPGTGHTPEGVRHKAEVVERALTHHSITTQTNAAEVLRLVGGLEIAALTGGMIAAAQQRLPVLVDGFIAATAACAAIAINATAKPYLIPATQSPEPGHAIALEALDGAPILNLGMRLGEGTGAGVALAVVERAVALYAHMHTFADANLPGPDVP